MGGEEMGVTRFEIKGVGLNEKKCNDLR